MELESYKHKFEKQEIDPLSLTTYLQQRFPDREQDNWDFISNFIRELNLYGKYRSIDDIERVVEATWDAFCQLEEQESRKFTAIGAVRTMLDLINDDFRRSRGISDNQAERLDKYRSFIKEISFDDRSEESQNLRRRRSDLHPIDYSDLDA